MTQSSPSTLRVRDNLLGLFAYLGAAPWLYLLRRDTRSVSAYHARQALAIFAMLLAVGILGIAVVLVISYVMVYHRAAFDAVPVEAYLLSFLRKAFLCWLVFWGFGAVLALIGSWREMPLVWRLARMPRLLRSVAGIVVGLQVLLGLVALITLDSLRLTRPGPTPAKVYYVYEDVDTFPRWLFTLAFYPMSRASVRCFGPHSVAVEKLDRDSIAAALSQGAVVFIGSHGTPRGLMVPSGYFEAHEITELTLSPELRFVYLTGCDQKSTWVDAFAPAEVVTYDRLTAVVEHLWWMVFEGPNVVCRIAEERRQTPSMGPVRPDAP